MKPAGRRSLAWLPFACALALFVALWVALLIVGYATIARLGHAG